MRLPNGYGSVEKLNGNRRNPWRVRITKSWVVDVSTGKVIQNRTTISYYPSKKEAMQALAAYNETPWSINNFTLIEWNIKAFPKDFLSDIPVHAKLLGLLPAQHLLLQQAVCYVLLQ